MINTSKKLGLKAVGVKSDVMALSDCLPVIAHTMTDDKYYHFVVVWELDKKSNKVVIADPAKGIVEETIIEFRKSGTGIFAVFEFDNKKAVNDKRFFECLKNIAHDNRTFLIKSILLSLCSIVVTLCFALYLKVMINNIDSSLDLVALIVTIFLLIAIIKNFLSYYRIKFSYKFNILLDQNITFKTYRHLLLLPYKYYQSRRVGEVLTIINDVNGFKEVVNDLFVTMLIDGLFVGETSIMLLIINYRYFIVVVGLVCLYYLLTRKYGDKYHTAYLNVKNSNINISNQLVEILEAYETIKNLNIYDKVLGKLKKDYYALEKNLSKYYKLITKATFNKDIIGDLALIVIIFFSYLLVRSEELNLSDLILFNSLFSIMLSSLDNMFLNYLSLISKRVSINKVLDLYETVQEKTTHYLTSPIKHIKFQHISFSYNDLSILQDINLDITTADKVFIGGTSGVGKSTLIKLLCRYFDASRGAILINNKSIKKYTSYDIRRHVTYVSQNELLFTDTIKNNICLGNIDEQRYQQICKIACVDDILIKNMIDDNYLLEDNASNLSGGERKRIIIARSLYHMRDVLIFDEAFNEISEEMEQTILKRILKCFSTKIIILISHRNNSMDMFNKKIKLEKGGIVYEKT